MHPGTEWLRQIDIDQDHYAGVLSACAGRIQHFHTGAREMGYFRAALAARNRIAGPAGFLYHGCHRPRRGALGFFQQHPHFSAPSSGSETSRADRRIDDAAWHRHLADRAVAEMSSGEAKRTLIARALV